jgi:hypothetical protein
LPARQDAALRQSLARSVPTPGREELANAYRAAGSDRQAVLALHEGLILNSGYQTFVSQRVALYRKIDANGCLDRDCPVVKDNTCKAARNVVDLYRKTGRGDADRLKRTATLDWACPVGMFP